MTRYQITVRGADLELDGHFDTDDLADVADLADALSPFGLVMASDIELEAQAEGEP